MRWEVSMQCCPPGRKVRSHTKVKEESGSHTTGEQLQGGICFIIIGSCAIIAKYIFFRKYKKHLQKHPPFLSSWPVVLYFL